MFENPLIEVSQQDPCEINRDTNGIFEVVHKVIKFTKKDDEDGLISLRTLMMFFFGVSI